MFLIFLFLSSCLKPSHFNHLKTSNQLYLRFLNVVVAVVVVVGVAVVVTAAVVVAVFVDNILLFFLFPGSLQTFTSRCNRLRTSLQHCECSQRVCKLHRENKMFGYQPTSYW